MMSKFSSLGFFDSFTKGNLSVGIYASRLQSGNDAYGDSVGYQEKISDLVHSEVVWTVYGWGKIVLINYVSLLGDDIKEPCDNKVLSQEISTHVVHIHLSKKDYISLSKIQVRSLDNLKFDFSTL